MSEAGTGLDQVQFELIFNEWYDPIRNFIYYKTGNGQLAEDIAQDVFLKLWEKRNEIRTGTIKYLLYTIANNLLINRINRQKVALAFASSVSYDSYSSSPEYELEMKEFDKKLQMALNDLDEKKRTVFLMNRIDEFTYNQIAENLGLSVKAVEKRMQKALAFLIMRTGKKF